MLPSNRILLSGVLIPNLPNNYFAPCSFINFDFLLPHLVQFHDNVVFSFFVFNTFESTFFVFFAS